MNLREMFAQSAGRQEKRQEESEVASNKRIKPEGLTDEQIARAERNRLEALNRKKARLEQGSVEQYGLQMDGSWTSALAGILASPEFRQTAEFVAKERKAGKTIFPPQNLVFHAFVRCPFSSVRVVIIGQDPYHQPRQAHGLCFSVQRGVAKPPSLVNIFKELENDVPGFKQPSHGCLEKWTDQGVLLLNAVLTVECNQAGSHANRGWERFTDRVIDTINRTRTGVVFLLWGGYAKAKGKGIDKRRHKVLEAAHPSPLSANRGGWFGCKHFSQTNEFLRSKGKPTIEWSLS